MKQRHNLYQYFSTFIFYLFITVFLTTASAKITQAQEIIRLTNGEWKPFQSADLPNYGPYSEIVTEAFKRVGIKVEYGFFPWKRAQKLVEKGEWDGTFFWIKTREREQNFLLSNIAFSTTEVIFYSNSHPISPNKLEDFAGLTMGRIDGSAFGEQFSPLIDDGKIDVQYAPSNSSLFKMLQRNRVDFIPELFKSGYDAIDDLPSSENPEKITHLNSFNFNWDYYLLISKINIKFFTIYRKKIDHE